MKRYRKFTLVLQVLPLVLVTLLLGAVILTSARLVSWQNEGSAAVRQTLENKQIFAQILSLVQDAETGQRGYLLTGDAAYLEPHQRAVTQIPETLATLRARLEERPQQQARLDQLRPLIETKLSETDKTIKLRNDGQMIAALALVQSGKGKVTMDQIRDLLAQMNQSSDERLSRDLLKTKRLGQLVQTAVILEIICAILLVAFAIWASRRYIRRLIVTQDSLQTSNRALLNEMEQREKAEDQMRQMHKMESLGQLTGGVAHDFNNMLAVIVSGMNLIQRKLERGEYDIQKFTDAVLDAATRAATLTSRLLAFSRQQPLAPVVIDVNRMVAGMSDLLQRTLGQHIQIETVLAGGLWKTHADPSQLENAILNIAVNAHDAMPEDGKLTIETANCHLDDSYSKHHPDVPAGQYVLIALTDTGTGMTPEVMAKAFDPFFTTKEVGKGTGLGLSQVFGFVKQTGGHLKIYSELGVGTTIKTYLPRFLGNGEHDDTRFASDGMSIPTGEAREIVLVVEDEDRVRTLSTEALRELGYTVIHAPDGPSALRMLDAHPDVDLLFTDIVMPGMSGRKLADEALVRHPNLKVLYTTGFTRNAVVHNGTLDFGVHFLAKPFSIEELAKKVREALDD